MDFCQVAAGHSLGPTRLQVDTRLLRVPPLTQDEFITTYTAQYPPPILLRELVTLGGSLSTSGLSLVWPEETWQRSRPSWAEPFHVRFTIPISTTSPTLTILPHDPHATAPTPAPTITGQSLVGWRLSAMDTDHLQAWVSSSSVPSGQTLHWSVYASNYRRSHRIREVLAAFASSHSGHLIDITPGAGADPTHWIADPVCQMTTPQLLQSDQPRLQHGALNRVQPHTPFFFAGPYLSIDEGHRGSSPLSAAAVVTATGARRLFVTTGNILEAHLTAWECILAHKPATRGQCPTFYDAQSPAAVIAKMVKFFPRFSYSLLTRPYGPHLWRLHRLWTSHTQVTAIKVPSHLASRPNGDADDWTTLTLDFLSGTPSTNPPPGPPITGASLTLRVRMVWPLTSHTHYKVPAITVIYVSEFTGFGLQINCDVVGYAPGKQCWHCVMYELHRPKQNVAGR
jgi:hypothetical protein